jgi:hypothetical protein
VAVAAYLAKQRPAPEKALTQPIPAAAPAVAGITSGTVPAIEMPE